LPVAPSASATFHGRDVFAPAAAQIAHGLSLDALGAPFGDAVVRRTPEAVRGPDGATMGVVISIDRFGNVITNLVARRGGTVEIAGRTLAIRRSYEDVTDGEMLALIGSNGLVEIATRNGSAAAEMGVRRGATAILRQAPG
jgi:S-adenosylmethionine hydrolase